MSRPRRPRWRIRCRSGLRPPSGARKVGGTRAAFTSSCPSTSGIKCTGLSSSSGTHTLSSGGNGLDLSRSTFTYLAPIPPIIAAAQPMPDRLPVVKNDKDVWFFPPRLYPLAKSNGATRTVSHDPRSQAASTTGAAIRRSCSEFTILCVHRLRDAANQEDVGEPLFQLRILALLFPSSASLRSYRIGQIALSIVAPRYYAHTNR